jgi:hypothetical protein
VENVSLIHNQSGGLFLLHPAILSHLDKMLSDEKENDVSNQLETLPILFTSHQNYDMSFASFLDSVKPGSDSVYANDTKFGVQRGCVVQQNRAGEFLFCEAVKVDVSLSDADLKKNAQNTSSLLKVLFEDPSEAQNWYEDVLDNLSDPDQHFSNMSSLFNNTNESGNLDGSLGGQDIFDQEPGRKQEVSKFLKSWCLFTDREFFRNVLVIVGEVNERIYGSKIHIPDRFLKTYNLDDEKVHAHMQRWTSSDISGHGYSYSAMVAGKKFTVQPEISHPKQFKLDKISVNDNNHCNCW